MLYFCPGGFTVPWILKFLAQVVNKSQTANPRSVSAPDERKTFLPNLISHRIPLKFTPISHQREDTDSWNHFCFSNISASPEA